MLQLHACATRPCAWLAPTGPPSHKFIHLQRFPGLELGHAASRPGNKVNICAAFRRVTCCCCRPLEPAKAQAASHGTPPEARYRSPSSLGFGICVATMTTTCNNHGTLPVLHTCLLPSGAAITVFYANAKRGDELAKGAAHAKRTVGHTQGENTQSDTPTRTQQHTGSPSVGFG